MLGGSVGYWIKASGTAVTVLPSAPPYFSQGEVEDMMGFLPELFSSLEIILNVDEEVANFLVLMQSEPLRQVHNMLASAIVGEAIFGDVLLLAEGESMVEED